VNYVYTPKIVYKLLSTKKGQLQRFVDICGVLHAINVLLLIANLNFMTIEVHSSDYIYLALCTHTFAGITTPAMLFPLLHFFLRMNFIQALGGYHCKPSAMCMCMLG
jgi:hypothetical protein